MEKEYSLGEKTFSHRMFADEDKSPTPTSAPAESKLGCGGSLVTVGWPLLIFGSRAVVCFIIYHFTGFLIFLFLGIICIALLCYSIPSLIKTWKYPHETLAKLTDINYSPFAEFLSILRGLWKGGHSDRKKQ